MKKFTEKFYKNLPLIFITLLVIVCRFISIWCMTDVYSDEYIILDHMKSIIVRGYDTDGNYLPLFPVVGAGRATFTYLYPMILCLSIIGVTPIRARFIQQIFTIIGCLLTAYGVKIWTKNEKIFCFTLLTGLTLPWGFVQANRIWDPSFVPFYFSIYFFFFALLMRKENNTNKENYIYSAIAFSTLVLLATVYPPVRIPAVAMWIYSLIWAVKEKKLKRTHIIIIFIISTIFALPLAFNLLDPEFNSRSMDLFLFNQDLELYQQLYVLVRGFLEMFNPAFLFIGGDLITRHSLPVWGMLGTLSILPLISLLRTKKIPSLAYYMIFTIIMSSISVALTYSYQPHSLRNCLCWLPFTILIAFGWSYFTEQKSKKVKLLCYILMAIQFILYFITYILYNNGSLYFDVMRQLG